MRSLALSALLTLLLPLWQSLAQAADPETAPPNILFIFSDDQCYRTIHELNNPEIETPNLDRLARRGTTFTHCYKLILYPQANKARLFDLQADPEEMNDLADDADMRPILRELFVQLQQLQAQMGDELDLTQTFAELAP